MLLQTTRFLTDMENNHFFYHILMKGLSKLLKIRMENFGPMDLKEIRVDCTITHSFNGPLYTPIPHRPRIP